MRSRADKIDEECVCIDSLVQRIRQLDGSTTVIVQREKSDPPDFWLSLSDRRLAVEVTSIVSDYGYPALCSALHSSVKGQCSGIAGTYAIEVFRRPSIPKNGSNQWKALVAEAVTSLRAMSGSPSTNPVVLLREREGRLTLSKWGDAGSGVGLLRVPEAKFEGDAQKELSSLIGVAIAKKFEKCTKKGLGNVCDGVVLALYDAYGFGDIDTVRQALSQLQGYEWLHSIYWTSSFSDCRNMLYPDSPGRSGEFLYSKEEKWHPCA